MRRKFHYFQEYEPYNFVTRSTKLNKNGKEKSSNRSLLGRRSKSLQEEEAGLRKADTSFCLRLSSTAKKVIIRYKTTGYDQGQLEAPDSVNKSSQKLKIRIKRQAKQEAPMFKPNIVRKIINRATNKPNVAEPQLQIKSMLDSKASHKNSRIFNKSSQKTHKSQPTEPTKSNQKIIQDMRANLAKRIFQINRQSHHNYQGVKSKLQSINHSLNIKRLTSTQHAKSSLKIPAQHSSVTDNLAEVRHLIREYMSHL